MRRRLHEWLGVATVFAIVTVLMQLTAGSVRGQAPSATAWGHPNLEGIWLDVCATPLERAAELGDREFVTAKSGPDGTRSNSIGPRCWLAGRTMPSTRHRSQQAHARRSSSIRRTGGFPPSHQRPSGRTKWSESGASCSCETQRPAGTMSRPAPEGSTGPRRRADSMPFPSTIRRAAWTATTARRIRVWATGACRGVHQISTGSVASCRARIPSRWATTRARAKGSSASST